MKFVTMHPERSSFLVRQPLEDVSPPRRNGAKYIFAVQNFEETVKSRTDTERACTNTADHLPTLHAE